MRFKSFFWKSIFLLQHMSFSNELELQIVSQVLERNTNMYWVSRHSSGYSSYVGDQLNVLWNFLPTTEPLRHNSCGLFCVMQCTLWRGTLGNQILLIWVQDKSYFIKFITSNNDVQYTVNSLKLQNLVFWRIFD